jgi:protein-disulfide isomerase
MRGVRTATIPFASLTLAALAAVAACSGASPTPEPPPRSAPPASFEVPGAAVMPMPVTADDPRDLPGLSPPELSLREKKVWWQLVSDLYAPCQAEAVSVRQCIEDARPCAACKPAALLLADKVKEGASSAQAREMYGMRFGPNVVQVAAADSPARGPVDAPITIMVWSDFECPHCRLALPLVEQVFDKYAPRIRLVHKFYPLRQHTHAEGAARAAIAAQNQGRYWEMERTLFAHQEEQGEADLARYAKELGLDMNRWKADLTADRTSKILERDHADAERAGLNGTPFILVNGRAFETGLFHVDPDLDAWVALELKLIASPRP